MVLIMLRALRCGLFRARVPRAHLFPDFAGVPHLGDEPREGVSDPVLVHQRQALLIVPRIPRVAARLAERPPEGSPIKRHILIAAPYWLCCPLQQLAGCLCAGNCECRQHYYVSRFRALL